MISFTFSLLLFFFHVKIGKRGDLGGLVAGTTYYD
jgi:hypothetical protein